MRWHLDRVSSPGATPPSFARSWVIGSGHGFRRCMNPSAEHMVQLTPPQAVDETTMWVWEPSNRGRGTAVVLAHGAGSGLDEPTLVALAAGLAGRGLLIATFNFGYRQAGRRLPDRGDRLARAFGDVLDAVASRYAPAVVAIGGRSMGGRVATALAARGRGDGVVALAYPLCPRGRAPDPRRTAHWSRIAVPVLLVHGDRDRMCPVAVLERARRDHLSDTVHSAHVVAGVDHGFNVRVRDERARTDVDRELVAVVDRWLSGVVEGAP